jgi:hypothetical protein
MGKACNPEVCKISWKFSLDKWEEIIEIHLNGLV